MSKRTKNVSPAKTTTLWMKWRDFSPPQKRNHSKVWLYVGQSRRLTIIYHEVNIGSILKSAFCVQSRFQQHIGINYELFSLFCGVFFLNRQLSLGISSVMYINDFINIVPFDVVFLIDGIIRTGKKIQSFFIIENKVSKPKSRNNCYSKRCFQRQRFEYELTKFDTLITF